MSGDGDTNMSSPSSAGSDMFPAANDQLPPNNTSPPASQEAQMSDTVTGAGQGSLTSGAMHRAGAPGDSHNETDLGENPKTREPGYGWTNKQAQEEYARAYDAAVDKDFPEKLQQYGDVLEQGS